MIYLFIYSLSFCSKFHDYVVYSFKIFKNIQTYSFEILHLVLSLCEVFGASHFLSCYISWTSPLVDLCTWMFCFWAHAWLLFIWGNVAKPGLRIFLQIRFAFVFCEATPNFTHPSIYVYFLASHILTHTSSVNSNLKCREGRSVVMMF